VAGAERNRLAFAALGFAVAAALSSWNPLSAPFGLVVGLAAAVLSARALRRGGARLVSGGALVLSAGAVVASALVLALTAGVGREPGGEPIVKVPPRADVEAELDAAAERTRAARERARAELEALEGSRGGEQAEREHPGGKR
jgi:hypothetical protein